MSYPSHRLPIALCLAAACNQSCSTPQAYADLQVPSSTKVALGAFSGSRVVASSLDDSRPRLWNECRYEAHTVNLAEGQRLTVGMQSYSLDPYLRIARQEGRRMRLVAENDDHDGQTASLATVIADVSGEYLIIASCVDPSHSGDYELTIDIAGPGGVAVGRGESSPMTAVGQKVRGSLASSDPRRPTDAPYQLVEFDADELAPIAFSLESSAFDTLLQLYRIDGKDLVLVAENDDANGGTDSEIDLTMPDSARYAVMVTTTDPKGRGEYELTIARGTPAPTPDWEGRYSGGGSPSGRYAVLVGLNDYPSTRNDLGTCVHDVLLMKNLLITKFGFEPKNVITITDRQATREHVQAAIRGHLGQTGPDGVAVFYFSGHGTQLDSNVVINDDRDYEDDGVDEAVCLWQDDGSGGMIIDDEIGLLLGALHTDNILTILDTCHSGTGSRALEDADLVHVKEVEWDEEAKATFAMPTRFLASAEAAGVTTMDSPNPPANHVLLAAAAPSETALAPGAPWPEINCPASLFTYYLVMKLREADASMTFDSLLANVTASVKGYGRRTGMEPEDVQTPQVEGTRSGESITAFLSAR